MNNLLQKFTKKRTDVKFRSLAMRKIKQNKQVLSSLKQYDEGKKDISTSRVKAHLSNI